MLGRANRMKYAHQINADPSGSGTRTGWHVGRWELGQTEGLSSPAALSNRSITGCLRKRMNWASTCNPSLVLYISLYIAQGISWTGYHFCPLSNFQWIFSSRLSRRHLAPTASHGNESHGSALLRDKQILLIQVVLLPFPSSAGDHGSPSPCHWWCWW